MHGTRWMRMAIAGAVVAAVGLCASPRAHAEVASTPRIHTAGDKLVRGLANFFTGFLEIPRNITIATNEDSVLTGWTVGLGMGLGYTVLRMGVGLYEVVTFPFPLPADYEPIVHPEFGWEAPGPRMK